MRTTGSSGLRPTPTLRLLLCRSAVPDARLARLARAERGELALKLLREVYPFFIQVLFDELRPRELDPRLMNRSRLEPSQCLRGILRWRGGCRGRRGELRLLGLLHVLLEIRLAGSQKLIDRVFGRPYEIVVGFRIVSLLRSAGRDAHSWSGRESRRSASGEREAQERGGGSLHRLPPDRGGAVSFRDPDSRRARFPLANSCSRASDHASAGAIDTFIL